GRPGRGPGAQRLLRAGLDAAHASDRAARLGAHRRGDAHPLEAEPRGGFGGPDVTPMRLSQLMARPPRALDAARAAALIEGRRVLVPGAGGTSGAELTRRAAALGPDRLILFDASEYNLYALDQEMAEARRPVAWTAQLGDVRDRARLEQLFA